MNKMNLKDLEIELKKIEAECEEKKKSSIIAYCDANNPYDIGDIISDHLSTIKIDKIKYTRGMLRLDPECIYYGEKLRKSDMKPFKNGDRECIYQSNINEVINETAR